MITINNADKLDPIQLMVVQEDIVRRHPNLSSYTITTGNNCIWVYWGGINLYYIFNGTKLVDVQID